MLAAPVNTATSGDNTIVAAPSGTGMIRVHGYVLDAGGAVSVTWKNDAIASLTGAMSLAANSALVAPEAPDGWFDLSPAAGLVLNLSAAVQVSGHVLYSVKGP
jgi:hypothetical protein